LEARLATFPVVVLTGARQTGKSTLAVELGGDDRAYLTLDDLSVLDQAEHAPDQLLSRAPRLTLDEVQRAPQLLLGIKRVVDAGRVPGQFLLTGSANLELLRGVSETLAGRAVYVTLAPMTASELRGEGSTGRWDTFLDHPVSEWAEILPSRPAPDAVAWTDLALRGGYPYPSLHLAAREDRTAWLEGYSRTYLERDLQQLASIDNLVGFQRLVRAAALRVGNVMNQADLARDVGLPPTTAQRYLHLLQTSYQSLTVEPYTVNRTKRLVKSPKLYWNDTGLALHLGAEDEPRGAHLENLIVNDLFAWRETRVRRPNILFWRTSKGAEVDLVIEAPTRVVPMEVKSATTVRARDCRHLETFLDEYPDRAPAAALLYTGSSTYWVSDRVLAVPIGCVL
jgi:predicted AAA+ superfamily ATPase